MEKLKGEEKKEITRVMIEPTQGDVIVRGKRVIRVKNELVNASVLTQGITTGEYGKFIGLKANSKTGLITRIREGFDVKSVEMLRSSLDVTQGVLGDLINMPTRTLARRKKTGRLHTDESERVYKYAALLERAEEVLEDRDEAVSWLKTPLRVLGGQTPLKYADTAVGSEEVMNLLGRIEHGVFS